MSRSLRQSLRAGAALALAFLCGLGLQNAVDRLQGRESATVSESPRSVPVIPQNPPNLPTAPPRTPGSTPSPTTSDTIYVDQSSGPGVAAGGLIAVTGSYGIGSQVLYVIDTETRQLAVYEARGGSKSTRRLAFVGARRIDLDLQLEAYNDESEFDYQALKSRFEGR